MKRNTAGILKRCQPLGLALCTLVAAAGCEPSRQEMTAGTPAVDKANGPVVYGEDDRRDVHAHSDEVLRERAQQSTVALMQARTIDATDPNHVRFGGESLGQAYELCSTERFRDDPTAAFCSGTLIDDDLVLTAGHCITNESDCRNTRFVFKYYKTSDTRLETVTKDDIFSCQNIVVREQAVVGGKNLDFGIIRMDRKATPRFTPAPVRAGNEPMTVGAGVAVIGAGSGIPFKIDSGGTVRDPHASTLDFFVASTDTFGGNSGSGVYELTEHTVAGILVRGENDYVRRGDCNVVNVCEQNGCRGEDITYVRPAINAFCRNNQSQRLCGAP